MKTSTGFTLIEIAIVLIVITLAISSLLIPVRVQFEQANRQETLNTLGQIKAALISYAAVNGRLPCPALDYEYGDGHDAEVGRENSTLCGQEGTLPWIDLGVKGYDAWGNLFRYRQGGTITVTVDDVAISANASVTTTAVAAVIFSYGKNNANDGASANNNQNYRQGSYVPERFDDILIWVSKNVI
jgi:type II secretory pathway pseudopilin PulG